MHGIILGGHLEREDTSESRNQLTRQEEKDKPDYWPSIKRSAGGHRIATWIREHDWDIEVIDFWPAWSREELVELFEKRVRKDTVWVGLSAMFPLGGSGIKNQNKVLEIMDNIQHLRTLYPDLVFIGGSQNISSTLGYHLDYYVGGFAEHGIIELLKMITGQTHNCIVHDREYWGKKCKVVECRRDYPAWPMPDARITYEERDFMRSDEMPMIELARGCRFQCKFCSFTVLGVTGDHSRSADSLREELTRNYELWGINKYTISDETINDSPEKLKKLADVIRALPFEVHLAGYMRADLLVAKPSTWEDIWDMGLWSHFYGIESFNHASSKYVGKGMHPDRLKDGLLKVQDWFQSKGRYRATLSTIIGLPHETRETFLDGRDWVMKNMPGHSYNFYPLHIGDGDLHAMATNPSEFDRTAWTSGVFERKTLDEMGYNLDEIPDSLKDQVEFYMQSTGVANWSHDTMDLWQAFKVFAEIASEPTMAKKLAPGIFFYHRYLTGGAYSLDDMMKTFDEIEPLGKKQVDLHKGIINEYKRKKLEWNDVK